MHDTPFADEAFLLDENNHGYGPQEIPNARDTEISVLMARWVAEARTGQVSLLTCVDAQRGTLLAYCERAASLAVRKAETKFLLYALATLGAVWNANNSREVLPILALISDAAVRLGTSADDLFGEAQRLSFGNEPYHAELANFLRRSPADKSIADMGYIAGAEQDGFRYFRGW